MCPSTPPTAAGGGAGGKTFDFPTLTLNQVSDPFIAPAAVSFSTYGIGAGTAGTTDTHIAIQKNGATVLTIVLTAGTSTPGLTGPAVVDPERRRRLDRQGHPGRYGRRRRHGQRAMTGIHRGAVVLEHRDRFWKCPSCGVLAKHSTAETAIPTHPCPALGGLWAQFFSVGHPDDKVDGRHVVVPYADGSGRPSHVSAEHGDGSNDVTVNLRTLGET